MGGVVLVRRGDVDGLHAGVGAERLDGLGALRRKSAPKRARAAGGGSAEATSSTRGCAAIVGSISVKARPRPRRRARADARSATRHRSSTSSRCRGARDTQSMICVAFSARQHEVAMIGVAGDQPRAAGAAGARLAGAAHRVRRAAQRLEDRGRPRPSTLAPLRASRTVKGRSLRRSAASTPNLSKWTVPPAQWPVMSRTASISARGPQQYTCVPASAAPAAARDRRRARGRRRRGGVRRCAANSGAASSSANAVSAGCA